MKKLGLTVLVVCLVVAPLSASAFSISQAFESVMNFIFGVEEVEIPAKPAEKIVEKKKEPAPQVLGTSTESAPGLTKEEIYSYIDNLFASKVEYSKSSPVSPASPTPAPSITTYSPLIQNITNSYRSGSSQGAVDAIGRTSADLRESLAAASSNTSFSTLSVSSSAATELITNGDFDGSASGWTLGTGWTYNNGKVTHTPGQTAPLSRSISVLAGHTYILEFEALVTDADICEIGLESDADVGSDVAFSQGFTPTNDHASIIFDPTCNGDRPGGDFDGSLDNISVTEMTSDFSVSTDGVNGLFVTKGNKVGVNTNSPVEYDFTVNGMTGLTKTNLSDDTILNVEGNTESGGVGISLQLSTEAISSGYLTGISSALESTQESTGDISYMAGGTSGVTHQGSGDVDSMFGLSAYVTNGGDGSILGDFTAGAFDARHSGVGTVPTLRALLASGINEGTGHVTDNQGLYVNVGEDGLGITNNIYGIYVNNAAGASLKNYAIYTNQTASSTNLLGSYALYNAGTAPSYFAGNLGVGTTSPWRTLSVTGTMSVSGLTLNTGAAVASLCLSSTNEVTRNTDNETCIASSERFKKNITDLSLSLNEIIKLRPVSFEYKDSEGTHYGLIAEEVGVIDPLLISHDDEGLPNGIRWSHLTAVIINAIKELNNKIASVGSWFKDGNFVVQKDVCVNDTCITKDQFEEMILRSGVGAVQIVNQPITSPTPVLVPEEVASSTPEIQIETEEATSTATSTSE